MVITRDYVGVFKAPLRHASRGRGRYPGSSWSWSLLCTDVIDGMTMGSDSLCRNYNPGSPTTSGGLIHICLRMRPDQYHNTHVLESSGLRDHVIAGLRTFAFVHAFPRTVASPTSIFNHQEREMGIWEILAFVQMRISLDTPANTSQIRQIREN